MGTATLHKELQAKQSLVNELRDAYDEMRKQSETSIKRSESTSSLRAKSGSRDPFLTTTLPGPTAAFRAKSGSRDTLAPKSPAYDTPRARLGESATRTPSAYSGYGNSTPTYSRCGVYTDNSPSPMMNREG